MTLDPPIYLDHHATTPVDPRVRDAMAPWLGRSVGNAGSTHAHGFRAAAAVAAARAPLFELVAGGTRVVATSGATEACNLALKGAVEAAGGPRGAHVVTTNVEHSAVLATCDWLVARGATVTRVRADRRGVVAAADVLRAVRPNTVVVAVMLANNEVGSVQPIEEICDGVRRLNARGRRRALLVFCDAVQGLGRVPPPPADMVSVSAHKMYGPQGVGSLVLRGDVELAPQVHGGSQEGGLRAGTVAVPLLIGLGAAAGLMVTEGDAEAQRVGELRDAMAERLVAGLGDGVVINGPWGGPSHASARLPGNLHVSFVDVCPLALGDATRAAVSVSSGSACRSGSSLPSPVLAAIGALDERSSAPIRFGLGRGTTEHEVDEVARLFVDAARRLRRAGCAR